jgi:NAD kinase
VLAAENVVELKLSSGDRAGLILDGQIEIPVHDEQSITIKLSSLVTRFLRFHPPEYFYQSLWNKLQVKRAI